MPGLHAPHDACCSSVVAALRGLKTWPGLAAARARGMGKAITPTSDLGCGEEGADDDEQRRCQAGLLGRAAGGLHRLQVRMSLVCRNSRVELAQCMEY